MTERTVYTTSEKNRIMSGGKGPNKTEMMAVDLQIHVPSEWTQEKIETTIQQAIIDEIEKEKGE